MADSISSLGIQKVCTNALSGSTNQLSKLTEQLSTGIKSSNMTDYTAAEAQNLMNLTGEISQQKGFQSVINTLSTRVSVYDTSLEGIEDTSSEAYSTLISYTQYNAENVGTVRTLVEEYMDQVEYFLNQQVGDRYIFSGSRYDQAPVTNLQDLPVPPTESAPYLATGDNVPAYDVDYDSANPTADVPEANVTETAKIDTTKTLTYGVTSNEDGFQQLIMGLRFAYAATYDAANYGTYMQTATDLISEGLGNIRAVHTKISNANASLEKTNDTLTSKINSLQTQIDNIESVDVNEVGVKITTLQAQLEASYSAVSKLVNMSIVEYL